MANKLTYMDALDRMSPEESGRLVVRNQSELSESETMATKQTYIVTLDEMSPEVFGGLVPTSHNLSESETMSNEQTNIDTLDKFSPEECGGLIKTSQELSETMATKPTNIASFDEILPEYGGEKELGVTSWELSGSESSLILLPYWQQVPIEYF